MTARWTSAAGSSLAPLALAFAALEISGSTTDLGVVLAAGMAAETLLPLAGGVIGDRHPRRRVQTTAYLTLGVLQLASAALLIGGVMRVDYLLTLAVASGAVTALAGPASAGVVPLTVPEQVRGRAVALESAGLNAVKVAGPAVGGVLIAAAGPGWAILVDAVSFLLAAALVSRLRILDPARIDASAAAAFRAGWSEFRRIRATVLLTASGAAVVPLWLASYLVLGPSWSARYLGGPGWWGIVVSGFTAGLLTGAALCLILAPTRPGWTTCLSAAVMAGPPAAMAADAHPLVLVAAVFAAGATLNASIVVWRTWLQQTYPVDMLARVTAVTGTGQRALVPCMYLAAGPAATWAGLRPTLAAAAVLLAVSALLPLATRDVRALRVHPSERALPEPTDRTVAVPRPGRAESGPTATNACEQDPA